MSDEFLAPGRYIDSDAPNVVAFARAAVGEDGDAPARVLRLYRAVRDDIIYDPYVDLSDPANFRASVNRAISGRIPCLKSDPDRNWQRVHDEFRPALRF